MGAAEIVVAEPRPRHGHRARPGLRLTPDTLRMLGVAPVHGRLLAGDGRARSATARDRPRPVAAPLRRRSRASSARTMRLDGETYTVVGVMPPRFVFAPFWAIERRAVGAAAARRAAATNRDGESLRVFARLKPGVSPAAAQADVDVVTARLEAAFPGTNRHVQVVPLKERVVGHTRARPDGAARRRRLRPADRLRQRRAPAAARAPRRGSRRSRSGSRSARRDSGSCASCSPRACCCRRSSGVVGLALARGRRPRRRGAGAARPAARRRHDDRRLDARRSRSASRSSTGVVFGLVPALAGGAHARSAIALRGARRRPGTARGAAPRTCSSSRSWRWRWCCSSAPG